MSKAMDRVVRALKVHAPRHVQFVKKEEDAEFVLIHVIGYPETVETVKRCVDRGQKYGIVQYCMRSTQRPNTRDWIGMWQHAEIVWSYYDLKALLEHDHPSMSSGVLDDGWAIKFYMSPLGVDPIFLNTEPIYTKMHTMLTSGFVAESEGVAEVSAAVKQIGGRHFHLGPKDAAPNADLWGMGISDPQLADVYARCCWVAGLRRCEGFEMPAAEGLVCGARPIMFDAPHYRRWFEPWAQFVPEGTFDEVVAAIVDIFEGGFKVPTDDERKAAVERFDWKRIIPPFWEGVAA